MLGITDYLRRLLPGNPVLRGIRCGYLGLLVAAAGCAAPAYRSAEISRNPQFGGGRATVTDDAAVRRLASYFPGVGTGQRIDLEIGGFPAYSVAFRRDDGRVDAATTSGRYDHAGLAAFVKPLFPASEPTTRPTR